jgi:hypothetical protein
MPQVQNVRLTQLTTATTGQWKATVECQIKPTFNEKNLGIQCRIEAYIIQLNQDCDRFLMHDDGRLEWNYLLSYDNADCLHGPIGAQILTFVPTMTDAVPVTLSGPLPHTVKLDAGKEYYAIVTARPGIHGDWQESSNRITPAVRSRA